MGKSSAHACAQQRRRSSRSTSAGREAISSVYVYVLLRLQSQVMHICAPELCSMQSQ